MFERQLTFSLHFCLFIALFCFFTFFSYSKACFYGVSANMAISCLRIPLLDAVLREALGKGLIFKRE